MPGLLARALVSGGTALGLAAGAAHGLLEVHRCADWRNGTLWLAGSRIAGSALPLGLAGGIAQGVRWRRLRP